MLVFFVFPSFYSRSSNYFFQSQISTLPDEAKDGQSVNVGGTVFYFKNLQNQSKGDS